MKKLITSLFITVVAMPVDASIRQYSADLATSQWTSMDNTRLQCTLTHQIPNYGEAKFSSKASREMNMEFELDMLRLPDTYGLAEVRAEAPSWKPGISGHTLAKMKLHKQYSPGLPKKVAWNMLSELERGMTPTFYYDDWYSKNDKITVGLSAAKFKAAYQEFVSCVGNLLNYNFDDISYTVLNYQFGGDKLTKASKRRIEMISEYLSLDPEMELVLIDAYTDSYGGRNTNLKVSQKRASHIREYFVKNGVDPTRIEAKGYGEKRHIASNNTVLGRSQNRRVVIRMEQN